MTRRFNVTGTCIPTENYMVDITDKLFQIKAMVDRREYFVINRGRQYGKTTTLNELRHFLSNDYTVISISFEGLGNLDFESETRFCQKFLKLIRKALKFSNVTEEYANSWKNSDVDGFEDLGDHITDMCENKKIVLMIDEVDKTSNNVIFLNFLSKLRSKFLARASGMDYTFHSVILAGVTDIRNIKLKMTQEGLHTPTVNETSTYNSPWNIASAFKVDMSFSVDGITGMLKDYENDHQTGMDTKLIAKEIYDYTKGYPVLVTEICKNIDEELDKDWTVVGVSKAVKLLLSEKGPLFDNLKKNLDMNVELSNFLYSIVILGARRAFNTHNSLVEFAAQYGYIAGGELGVEVSNLIFKTFLIDYYTEKALNEANNKNLQGAVDSGGIVVNGEFNMDVCLEKFSQYFQRYYSKTDERFIEREGRMLFLMFLSPILNGQGFAYIEAQSPDGKRTDLIINYLAQQFVVELKIWDGPKKHEEAVNQLLGYMDRFQKDEGYLLTFGFRESKVLKHEWINVDGNRKILDVVV